MDTLEALDRTGCVIQLQGSFLCLATLSLMKRTGRYRTKINNC